MRIDPSCIPFSRAGAYMALSWLGDEAPLGSGLYLRNLHGDTTRDCVCRIELFADVHVSPFDIEATFDALSLRSAEHSLQCIFSDVQTLRCAGAGAERGICLTFPLGLYDHALPHHDGWQINSFSNRRSYALKASRGIWRVAVDDKVITAIAEPDGDGSLDISVTEFLSEWPTDNSESQTSFAMKQQQIAMEFARFQAALPAPAPPYMDAHALAAYTLWSARVQPHGHLRRDAVLMSNNWMRSVWSWDHCFIAMALARTDAALAWDQFMLPFDVQNAAGALPDCINDTAIIWNFCKPPVHGWTLRWMQGRGFTLDAERLRDIYEPLCRWTQWWLTYRDDHRSGLAYYNHGNDSGWDNATLFDAGAPLATPDLSAFLVVQMQALAELARKLNRADDAQQWQRHANHLLDQLLREFWRDDHFVALRADGSAVRSDTLLLQMPLILGNSLPPLIREQLLVELQRFVTPHGLATENPHSPSYAADSYWRGPVWAPVIFLIVESLREIGAIDFAEQLRIRFCDTVAASGGMAENFDALTGRGLRDPAHTWTAAVFVLLAAA